MINRYVKKPVEIEAIKFEYTTECLHELSQFCGESFGNYGKSRHPDALGWLEIKTLEDGFEDSPHVKHLATEGDYIIKGVANEFYACKPDIFHKTYEIVWE